MEALAWYACSKLVPFVTYLHVHTLTLLSALTQFYLDVCAYYKASFLSWALGMRYYLNYLGPFFGGGGREGWGGESCSSITQHWRAGNGRGRWDKAEIDFPINFNFISRLFSDTISPSSPGPLHSPPLPPPSLSLFLVLSSFFFCRAISCRQPNRSNGSTCPQTSLTSPPSVWLKTLSGRRCSTIMTWSCPISQNRCLCVRVCACASVCACSTMHLVHPNLCHVYLLCVCVCPSISLHVQLFIVQLLTAT